MNVHALLQKLREVGVCLSRDGMELVVDAPDGALTVDLVLEIRDAKEDILCHLDQSGALLVTTSVYAQ